jgi:hypothetical protein
MLQQIIIHIFSGFSVRAKYFFLTAFIFTAFPCVAVEAVSTPILLHAARVFDGHEIRNNVSVLIKNGQVAQIAPRESFNANNNVKIIDLGDATILPGFIELHAHLSYQNVPKDTVLKHGITTIRDLGGPVHKPYGGTGSLRVLTSGPIITAPHGYPIVKLGATDIAVAVSTPEEARQTVRNLIEAGAVVIKIALEPGGEAGAPWSSHYGHTHHEQPDNAHGHAHLQPAHKSLTRMSLLHTIHPVAGLVARLSVWSVCCTTVLRSVE